MNLVCTVRMCERNMEWLGRGLNELDCKARSPPPSFPEPILSQPGELHDTKWCSITGTAESVAWAPKLAATADSGNYFKLENCCYLHREPVREMTTHGHISKNKKP